MKDFALYLMKSGIWIGVFWSFYRIFLRKDTFYKFNRFFLLAGLIASFLIPLYNYRYLVTIDWPLIINDAPQVPLLPTESIAWKPDLWFILSIIYLLGAVCLLIRRFAGVRKIRRIIKQQGYTRESDSKIVHLNTHTPVFSIFNYIFINLSNTSEPERRLIYEHEKAHIEQRHWIDLTLLHAACIFHWFNPFIWLYLQAVKQNHEFQADKAVLRKGYSLALYCAALINYTFNAPVFAFANAFAQYNKSKRINMMMKEVSRPIKKCAVLLLIPALAVFFWAFSEPEYVIKPTEPARTTGMTLIKVTTSPDNPRQTKVSEVNLTGTVRAITADNKRDKVIVVNDDMQHEESGMTSDTVIHKQQVISDLKVRLPDNQSPLCVIDGKVSTLEELNKLDPQNIKSFSVLKSRAAVDEYGEKGANGVIIIETNGNSDKPETNELASVPVEPANRFYLKDRNVILGDTKFLFIVDGKEFPESSIELIDPANIESISILKDSSAAKIYGEKGRNGVIIITMKK